MLSIGWPQLVVLWTDALIYVLLAVVIAFIWFAAKRPHLARPWSLVLTSRTGLSTLIVLLFYVVIGLLDSIHYRPQASDDEQTKETEELLSTLDYVLSDLRHRQEKTYSAPLATHLYSKENIELDDGTTLRDYPRLQYGGAHLADPQQDWAADIAWLTIKGALLAVPLWLLAIAVIVLVSARRQRQEFIQQWWRIWRNKAAVPWRSGFVTLLLLFLVAGSVVSLSGQYHLLGTDKVGEDVLYQALKSIRTGLVIGTLTTLVMLPAAILLGIMAGYFKGWVDDVIQYTYTTLNSIPGVLLIAAAILMMQIYISNHEEQFTSVIERADIRLLFLCMILGVTSWTGLCRLLRGESFKLRELDYVQASTAFGVGNFTIILRHIMPNVLHIVMITVVLDFSGLVLAEAVLSYVNIGVDPSTYSWGNMINSARLEMAREPVVWWSLSAALLFMFTLVLAANLFSDVVRDAFDPRLRSQS
ncbi:MAG: ABC transporter permease [Chromatiales bacterium]|jgi:peptide/nickel transport system permease protein